MWQRHFFVSDNPRVSERWGWSFSSSPSLVHPQTNQMRMSSVPVPHHYYVFIRLVFAYCVYIRLVGSINLQQFALNKWNCFLRSRQLDTLKQTNGNDCGVRVSFVGVYFALTSNDGELWWGQSDSSPSLWKPLKIATHFHEKFHLHWIKTTILW